MIMHLQVTNPYICAGATFKKEENGFWHCVNAAPILRWMMGMDTQAIVTRLRKKGFTYEWMRGDDNERRSGELGDQPGVS